MADNTLSTSGPEGTIPVDYAKQLTANWRTYLEISKQGFATHAFLIPIEACKNILQNNPDAEGVRAYIGLDDPANLDAPRLMLVPVIDGKDVLYLPKANKVTAKTEGEGDEDDDDSNVYDLTKPCPPFCDDGGLNG